jgi:chromate transporter
VTFVPSFLFVLLGAPYMERLRGNHSLSAALTGITAAVVGVIANLGVYFAIHTLFNRTVDVDSGPLSFELPDLTTLRPVPLVIALVAAVLIFRIQWSVLRTLGVCAVLGLAAGLAGLPLT